MEITNEQTDALNATIKIKVQPSDYEKKVNKELQQLQSKITVPGFRKGHVPMGMVKKMYGPQLVSETVLKESQYELFNYLKENNIQFFGDPLLNSQKTEMPDWKEQDNFEFYYDLGLHPEFELKMPAKTKFLRYNIFIDDEALKQEIDKLTREFGTDQEVDVAEEGDMVTGTFVELNKDNTEKEGGLRKDTYILLRNLKEEKGKKQLLGVSSGKNLFINAKKVYKDEATAALYLGIQNKEDVAKLSDNFLFKVTKVNRMLPAKLDQEFYDKVFGKDQVKSFEDFKNKLSEAMQQSTIGESKAKLLIDIKEKLLEKNQFNLPEEFLKRFIRLQNKDNDKVDLNNLDSEFDKGKDSMRWNLISRQIQKEADIKITEEEVDQQAINDINRKAGQMGYNLPEDKLKEIVEEYKKNERNRIEEQISDVKVLDYMAGQVKISDKDITLTEFGKRLAKNK